MIEKPVSTIPEGEEGFPPACVPSCAIELIMELANWGPFVSSQQIEPGEHDEADKFSEKLANIRFPQRHSSKRPDYADRGKGPEEPGGCILNNARPMSRRRSV